MKKIFALILALVMVLGICGCGGDTEDVESQEIVYEQIYLDENGNPISSIPSATTSSEDQSADKTDDDTTSSNDSSSNTDGGKNINIDYDTVVEVDICNDVIRAYLEAETPTRQFEWLTQYSGQQYDKQYITLDWLLDASYMYTVTFSENADFSNSHSIQTKFTDITNSMLIPGKTYYWKVTGSWSDKVLGGGKIHVKDAPVRWVSVDGVGNVRDMGGWKAENGKTVKYGMLYRGKALGSLVDGNPKIYVTDEGLQTIKALGWKTELDIRYAHQKFQTPDTGMNYEFIESPGQYHTVMTESPDTFKASYKRVFELLANEKNYPFYAHCNAGADRTGTFAFIVNGVLGVSYEDLTRDFELTSFSSSGKRWRSDSATDTDGAMTVEGNMVAWGQLYDEMMKHGKSNGCTTLQQSIEHWLISYIGVPKAHIDSFKNIVLE